jgi:YidC/Oxa1 family membrane protein insertase
MLKRDYEEAQRKMAELAAAEKEAEKERRRLAAEKKAAAADKKAKKKVEAPKAESTEPSINKGDSRVGMRAYARGRAYDPNRYPTFPYHDPSQAAAKEEEAVKAVEEEIPELPVAPAEAPVEVKAEAAEDTSADYEAPYAEENNEE